tara:strand:- start:468 stop:701 length:234 start_codon:yes stop_codon:yes gene_type:complete
MQIKEIDCKVLFYCEYERDIEVLYKEWNKVDRYREDLIYEGCNVFKTKYGENIVVLDFEHTDAANRLQIEVYRALEH